MIEGHPVPRRVCENCRIAGETSGRILHPWAEGPPRFAAAPAYRVTELRTWPRGIFGQMITCRGEIALIGTGWRTGSSCSKSSHSLDAMQIRARIAAR